MVDKIKRIVVEDDAVTQPKIAAGAVDNTALNKTSISGLSELTDVANNDELIILDTSANQLKKIDKSNTTALTFPTYTSVSPTSSQTVDGGNITFTITGSGFTAGTNARLISNTGVKLNFDTVTRTNTTTISGTIARSSLLLAQSPYDIQVINGEGLSVVGANQITIDNTPVFVTSAGSLGTFTEGDSIDVTVVARDPDSSSAVTFELQSGSLPAGLSLVNQSGDSCRITGTASAVSSDTTSNFTLRAFDSASNTVSRAFSITINDFTMNSARFDSSSGDYLNRTPSSASNRRTFTFSTWAKLCKFDTTGYTIISAGNSASGEDGEWVLKIDNFGRDGQLIVQTGPTVILETTQALRDPSAWYHIVIAVDTTNSTSGNRVRMYINGSEVSDFDVENQPSLNQDFAVNNNVIHEIGSFARITSQRFDGYLSETILVDGQQLTPTSFGETDSNGVWVPKAISGLTFGTNGFKLDYADAADLGDDESGNGNDFAEQTIASDNKTSDTPLNNYATLNPLGNYFPATTFSEGNLKGTYNSSNYSFNNSTIGVSSGKWYFETKIITTATNNQNLIGISDRDSIGTTDELGSGAYQYAFYGGNSGGDYPGRIRNNNSYSSYSNGTTYTANDIIGTYVDLDNNKIYFAKNGTILNSGTGFTITAASSTDTGFYFLSVGSYSGSNSPVYEVNFGNPIPSISSGYADANGHGNFKYSPNDGGSASFDSSAKNFYALNTKNLAEFG